MRSTGASRRVKARWRAGRTGRKRSFLTPSVVLVRVSGHAVLTARVHAFTEKVALGEPPLAIRRAHELVQVLPDRVDERTLLGLLDDEEVAPRGRGIAAHADVRQDRVVLGE